jgi:hypothetical protein
VAAHTSNTATASHSGDQDEATATAAEATSTEVRGNRPAMRASVVGPGAPQRGSRLTLLVPAAES